MNEYFSVVYVRIRVTSSIPGRDTNVYSVISHLPCDISVKMTLIQSLDVCGAASHQLLTNDKTVNQCVEYVLGKTILMNQKN